jgi:flagellar biosynthetic protein FliS
MYANPMASKLQSYQRTTLETHSGPELLVELCEGAVSMVERAMDCEEPQERAHELFRARRIVVALQESLSVELGGVIAVNLLRHYTFLSRKLLEAHQSPMDSDLELLRGKLVDLRDTWTEAVRIHTEESYAAARAS